MDALAAELGQLKNQPARRAELVQQISDLSRLSRAIKIGEDHRSKIVKSRRQQITGKLQLVLISAFQERPEVSPR